MMARAMARGYTAQAPLSKPERARLILTSTAGIIAGVLSLWLFAWVIARKPVGLAAGWVAARGPAAPVLAFQEDDIQSFGPSRGGGEIPALNQRGLEGALASAFGPGAADPSVLYLSAPGVTLGGRATFLVEEAGTSLDGSEAPVGSFTAEDLAERLAQPYQRRVLIILDAGQVGTDRGLGVFGNGFLPTLAARLKGTGTRGVAILSSCAPGQISHGSERDRHSVFAAYVARGLSGEAAAWDPSGRLTVQGLARFVSHHVRRWVESHRQSTQTPILLGDVESDFPLRPVRLTMRTAPGDEAVAAKELEALAIAWHQRDQMALSSPERHTPVLWVRYLDSLLRAEKLFRAGRATEMAETLSIASSLVEPMKARRDGWPRGRAWSLAESARDAGSADPAADERKQPKVDEPRKAILAALDRLTGRVALTPATPVATAPATVSKEKEEGAKAAPRSGLGTSGGEAQGAAATTGGDPLPSLAGLVDREQEQVPTFLEGQTLVWAIRYARRPGASSFRGARGELLREVVAMQGAAERAAARDERTAWRRPELDRIDRDHRRPAQDGLFGQADAALESARRGVADAMRDYEEWESNTAEAGAALDLLNRVQAGWPYLGEWLARRGRSRSAEVATMLEQSVALARAFASEPPAAEEALRLAIPLRRGWEGLEAELLAEAEHAQNSGTRWREIDDLLTVPFLPADRRMALLARLRSLAVAGTLAEDSTETPALPATEAIDSSPPDPGFWPAAVGQAEVELALLRMGGGEGPEVDTLRLALESARNARGEPVASAEALAQFSARVPAARAELLRRARRVGTSGVTEADDAAAGPQIAQADRAARSLPAAWTRSLSGDAAPDTQLDRWHRYRHLLATARRLLGDFAPEHAELVLAEARKLGETHDLRQTLKRADAQLRARLVVTTDPAESLTLGDQAVRLKVVARPEDAVPEGRGAVLLGYDPTQPIAVRRAGMEIETGDAEGTVRIAGSAPAEVEYLIDRTEYSPEAATVELASEVFYRGRSFPAASPLAVALDPAKEAVTITLRDPNPRGFRDQYSDHPGRGFLHYNAGLGYRLELRNNTEAPLTVWVSAALDGQTSPPHVLTIPPGKSDSSLSGRLQAVDLPSPKPDAPPPPPGPDEAPLGRARVLTVEVREKNESGRALATIRRYSFEQLPVEQYAAATAHFSPNDGRVYVVLHHLAADRVNGPVFFQVTVAGMNQRIPVPKGQSYTAWFGILPPWPEKVKYSVQVGDKPNAFSGEVSTGIPVAPPEPKGGATPPAGPKL